MRAEPTTTIDVTKQEAMLILLALRKGAGQPATSPEARKLINGLLTKAKHALNALAEPTPEEVQS